MWKEEESAVRGRRWRRLSTSWCLLGSLFLEASSAAVVSSERYSFVRDGSWAPQGFALNLSGGVFLDEGSDELFVTQRLSPHVVVLNASPRATTRML